ncbi:HutD family protein [Thalassotalea fonticola]|uniref:HutD family protein n=1 Tax=Thalassotalea fonticola TaxID=3065649 RepID=A0ABZ0GQ46_9GAMM|nr:HutD family protein [Colwelliaceae bacterium S1-1]
MLEIISPEQFTTSVWKNGKGKTIELAISENGTIDSFDWRLSIATVSEDGVFSNFCGLARNLILIDGNGIELKHTDSLLNKHSEDRLQQLLSVATFDGGNTTYGKLINGTITDFNLMHNPCKFSANVNTCNVRQTIALQPCDICFIYPLINNAELTTADKEAIVVPAGNLLKISKPQCGSFMVSGEQLIMIHLTEVNAS